LSWRWLLWHNWISTWGWYFRATILLDKILTMLKKFILNIKEVVFWTKRITFFSGIWCVLWLWHSSEFFNRWWFELRVWHLFFLKRRDFLSLICLSGLLSVLEVSFLWKLLVWQWDNLLWLSRARRSGWCVLTLILVLYLNRWTLFYITICETKAYRQWKLRYRINKFLGLLLVLADCRG
jgi:hypothetical protein